MRYLAFIAFFPLMYSEIASGQGIAGSIAGSVLDREGRAVPAATVSFRRQAEFSRDGAMRMVRKDPGISGAVTAKQDGSFLISGLGGGRYMVCAKGPGPKSLTGCAWGGNSRYQVGSWAKRR